MDTEKPKDGATRRAKIRAAQREAAKARHAAAATAQTLPPKQPFKFRILDAITVIAIPLGFAGMIIENNTAVFICFAISALVICISVFSHTEIILKWRAALSASVSILFLLLYYMIRLQNLEKELAKYEGVLEPGNKASLNRNCRPATDDLMAAYLGPNTFHIKQFPQKIISIAGRDILILNKIEKKIYISKLELFDNRGDSIAVIDDRGEPSRFWIANNVRKERPDKSTLVVYDRTAEEVLRIEYLNETAISIMGKFKYGNRAPLILQPNYFEMGGISGRFGTCSPNGASFEAIFRND